jgi:hypothetical protein
VAVEEDLSLIGIPFMVAQAGCRPVAEAGDLPCRVPAAVCLRTLTAPVIRMIRVFLLIEMWYIHHPAQHFSGSPGSPCRRRSAHLEAFALQNSLKNPHQEYFQDCLNGRISYNCL